MINFAVGPVMMDEEIRSLGAQEIPYFRTPEFSALMKENRDSDEAVCESGRRGAGAVSHRIRNCGHGGGGSQSVY